MQPAPPRPRSASTSSTQAESEQPTETTAHTQPENSPSSTGTPRPRPLPTPPESKSANLMEPPPAHTTRPTQTFLQFKTKVEQRWGGSFQETLIGDLVIKIPRPSVFKRDLLNELSATDGKHKEMVIYESTMAYTIIVEGTKLRDLLPVGKEEEVDGATAANEDNNDDDGGLIFPRLTF